MLLNSLHIKGFRGFTDFKVEGLGRVNLIIGRNNAGKTTLLEAIGLLQTDIDLPAIQRDEPSP
jgi:AAA15 family ATPase/GTPase